MSTKQVYHYVYRITNIVVGKHYYGKRSSNVVPALDIGIRYFSSSTDKAFIQDQKVNPQNYKYKIVSTHLDPISAVSKEVILHNKFDVGINPKFYNKVKQTSSKLDTTGFKASVETRAKLSSLAKGRKHSEETKNKMSKAAKGRKHLEKSELKMSVAASGSNNHRAKKANVYNYYTNELIAENVCITVWAKNNGYDQGTLSATAKADRTSPSRRKNCHHCKGVYITYVQ